MLSEDSSSGIGRNFPGPYRLNENPERNALESISISYTHENVLLITTG